MAPPTFAQAGARRAPDETNARSQMAAEVCAGLALPGQKELPSKYLYDEVGSALFEVICVLQEYGLTRACTRLIQDHAADIAARVPSPAMVAELGSGSGRKARWVLQALARRQHTTYFPIEISRAALTQTERELRGIDAVSVVGFEREYLDGLGEVAQHRPQGVALLVLFLGSSIGNFDRPAGDAFLRRVRAHLRPGDRLLLATDLVKPAAQLVLAYDDPAGVTAAFNRNLLARINRELGADFDLAGFAHEARYNAVERRVEMHLRSLRAQRVRVAAADYAVDFRAGETIWTESSHKYDPDELGAMAARTGYRLEAQWIDREWPFAQSLFAVD
jgi:dimethylhistidine N-methyltransferase